MLRSGIKNTLNSNIVRLKQMYKYDYKKKYINFKF